MSINAKFSVLPFTLTGNIHCKNAKITRAELEISLLLEHKVKPVPLGVWKGDIAGHTEELRPDVHSYFATLASSLVTASNWKSFASICKEKIPASCCANAKVQIESKISGVKRRKSDRQEWFCKSSALIPLTSLLAVDGEYYEALLPLTFSRVMVSGNAKVTPEDLYDHNSFLLLRILCSSGTELNRHIPKLLDFDGNDAAVNIQISSTTLNGEYVTRLVQGAFPDTSFKLTDLIASTRLDIYSGNCATPTCSTHVYDPEPLQILPHPTAEIQTPSDKWTQIAASPFRWTRNVSTHASQGIFLPLAKTELPRELDMGKHGVSMIQVKVFVGIKNHEKVILVGTTVLPLTKTSVEKQILHSARLTLEKPVKFIPSGDVGNVLPGWDISGQIYATWHCSKMTSVGGISSKEPSERLSIEPPVEPLPQLAFSNQEKTLILDQIGVQFPPTIRRWMMENRSLVCLHIQPHGRQINASENSKERRFQAALQFIGGCQYFWTLTEETSFTELLVVHSETAEEQESHEVSWNKPLILHRVTPDKNITDGIHNDEKTALTALSIRILAVPIAHVDFQPKNQSNCQQPNKEDGHLSSAHKIASIAHKTQLTISAGAKIMKIASGRIPWVGIHESMLQAGATSRDENMELHVTEEFKLVYSKGRHSDKTLPERIPLKYHLGSLSRTSKIGQRHDTPFSGILCFNFPLVHRPILSVPWSFSKSKVDMTSEVSELVWAGNTNPSTANDLANDFPVVYLRVSRGDNNPWSIPCIRGDICLFSHPTEASEPRFVSCIPGTGAFGGSGKFEQPVFTATSYLQVDSKLKVAGNIHPITACVPIYPVFLEPGELVEVHSYFVVGAGSSGSCSETRLPIAFYYTKESDRSTSNTPLKRQRSDSKAGHMRNLLMAICEVIQAKNCSISKVDSLPIVQGERHEQIPLLFEVKCQMRFMLSQKQQGPERIDFWPIMAFPQNFSGFLSSRLLENFGAIAAVSHVETITAYHLIRSISKSGEGLHFLRTLEAIRLATSFGTFLKFALEIVDKLSADSRPQAKKTEPKCVTVTLCSRSCLYGLEVSVEHVATEHLEDLALALLQFYGHPKVVETIKLENVRAVCVSQEVLSLLIAMAIECLAPQTAPLEGAFKRRVYKTVEKITKQVEISWKHIIDYSKFLVHRLETTFLSAVVAIKGFQAGENLEQQQVESIDKHRTLSRRQGAVFRIVILQMLAQLGYQNISIEVLTRINCITSVENSNKRTATTYSHTLQSIQLEPQEPTHSLQETKFPPQNMYSPVRGSSTVRTTGRATEASTDSQRSLFPPVPQRKSRVTRNKQAKSIYLHRDNWKGQEKPRPKPRRKKSSSSKIRRPKSALSRNPTILSRNIDISKRPISSRTPKLPFSPLRSSRHTLDEIEMGRLRRKNQREHIMRSENYRNLVNSFENVSSQSNREKDQMFKLLEAFDTNSIHSGTAKDDDDPNFDTPRSSARSHKHESSNNPNPEENSTKVNSSDEARDILETRMKRFRGLWYCAGKALAVLYRLRKRPTPQ